MHNTNLFNHKKEAINTNHVLDLTTEFNLFISNKNP